MRAGTVAMAIAGLVVMGVGLCAAPPARAAQSAEETQIRDVIRKYVDAREKRDAKAVEGLFTADADQLTSSGDWRKGRPDVVKGTIASSQNTGGTRTITIETVRVIAPGVAIADGRYEIAGLAGGGTRSMWTSFTLAHAAEGWRIAAIRNMLPAAPVPPAAPAAPPPPPPPAPKPPAPPR
jgi:uncharacterized protein (TIGR02246 family)